MRRKNSERYWFSFAPVKRAIEGVKKIAPFWGYVSIVDAQSHNLFGIVEYTVCTRACQIAFVSYSFL